MEYIFLISAGIILILNFSDVYRVCWRRAHVGGIGGHTRSTHLFTIGVAASERRVAS